MSNSGWRFMEAEKGRKSSSTPAPVLQPLLLYQYCHLSALDIPESCDDTVIRIQLHPASACHELSRTNTFACPHSALTLASILLKRRPVGQHFSGGRGRLGRRLLHRVVSPGHSALGKERRKREKFRPLSLSPFLNGQGGREVVRVPEKQ